MEEGERGHNCPKALLLLTAHTLRRRTGGGLPYHPPPNAASSPSRPTTGCQSPRKVVGLWLQEGMYSVGRTPESGLEGRAAGVAWRDQGSGWRDAGPPTSPRFPHRADPGICSQARLPHPDPRAELAVLQQL